MLKPGGRIAGYVIHTPPSMTPAAERRIAELIPMDVLAEASPDELCRRAGFSIIGCADLTDEFRVTAEAIVRAREALETELRASDGDEVYEGDQTRKTNALVGIDEGLLRRSLIAAAKP